MSARIITKHAHVRCVTATCKTLRTKEKNLRETSSNCGGSREIHEVLTGSTGSIRPFAPARAIASMQGMLACRSALNYQRLGIRVRFE
jgi:hypothetical protein